MSTGSFAAAQARIHARQEARRQEALALQQSQHSLASSSVLGRLPFPLNRAAHPLTSLYTTLLDDAGTRPSLRVGQVDAELLDEELLSLLKSQVGDALRYFNPHVSEDWTREIHLALRAVLFKLSIWDNDASYGAALQGLRYTDARVVAVQAARPSRMQKGVHGLITVAGRYAWEKYEDYLTRAESTFEGPSEAVRRLSGITTRLSTAYGIASFVSFAEFLLNGRYRTLTDRVLRMRLVSPDAQTHREVSFEYLNRQLVWHAFTEFLLFLLPLVGISRWRRILSRSWRKIKSSLTADPDVATNTMQSQKTGPLAHLPERTCAICYAEQNPGGISETEVLGANVAAGGGIVGSVQTDIVNAYETVQCQGQCIYCFVCIASKIEGEEGGGWTCLRCGEVVYSCRPWRGDVLIEGTKNKAGKSVGFVEAEEDFDGGTGGEDMQDGDRGEDDREENQEQPVDAALDSELGTSQWQFEGQSHSQAGREPAI